jgi:pimeloyl-ACP methyl ester carboxylesterase
MKFKVQGHDLYAYTGGKAHRAGQPTVVFIHGVLNDHSVWILQSRYLAHHGWNVLAIDLPGHGKSEGSCPKSVQEAAEFILDMLDAAGISRAALVGHSWGSLIALHAASLAPERVSHLAMVGTAYPMRVSQALLDNALHKPMHAIQLVNQFSHSTLCPPPSALGPGTWLYGGSQALMRRVLASNPRENIFHTGFVACDSYQAGEPAMSLVSEHDVKVAFILGNLDQMTPPKAARALIDLCPKGQVVTVAAGHQMMLEAPEQVLQALSDHLRR